ncbi:MAG: hypothetical protein WCA64_02150 [Gallionella sp.]
MNTADMLIYVHPELDNKVRSQLASSVEGSIGVDCAEFDKHEHPHALMVRYDPDSIHSRQILDKVRKIDPVASIVGL